MIVFWYDIGQKQRVSIARALYSDKDLIVLDDIFSAVDAHVGRHLWEKAVKGFLMSEGKTVLLVTNQLQYVPGADHIVMLKNGSIIEQGTFKDLMNAKADFSDMIREYGVFDDDKDGEEEDAAIKKPASPNHAGDSDSSELGIVDISKGTSKQAEAFKAAKGALTFAENKESGNIGLSVYWGYAKAGGAFLFVCNLILYCVRIASRVNNAIFLSTWASLGPMAYQVQPQIVWQSVWLAEVFVEILAVLSNSLILAYWAANASRYLHNRMFSRVLRAPIAFFDSTPIGRLLARFSKDMNLCDTLLPQQWDQMFNMYALSSLCLSVAD
jgi:ABC-type multidrug transport system fused ATPase/permease subunit